MNASELKVQHLGGGAICITDLTTGLSKVIDADESAALAKSMLAASEQAESLGLMVCIDWDRLIAYPQTRKG